MHTGRDGPLGQITDGEDGVLIDDPTDLAGFGDAINRLLGDDALAPRIDDHGYERAHRQFLGDSHLERHAALLASLLSEDRP